MLRGATIVEDFLVKGKERECTHQAQRDDGRLLVNWGWKKDVDCIEFFFGQLRAWLKDNRI